MARPIRVTVSAVAVSAPIPLDTYADPFSVGLAVVLSSGASLTYTVQHTFDDVYASNFNPATATWFPNAGLADKVASSDGNYAFPITACRLNVTVRAVDGGTATMTVIQAG